MRLKQKVSLAVTLLTALFYTYRKGFSHGRTVERKHRSATEAKERIAEEAREIRE